MSRAGDLLQPILPNKNVTFSVMMVEGVEWVCEQLSETQCKPLYPKVRRETIKKLFDSDLSSGIGKLCPLI